MRGSFPAADTVHALAYVLVHPRALPDPVRRSPRAGTDRARASLCAALSTQRFHGLIEQPGERFAVMRYADNGRSEPPAA